MSFICGIITGIICCFIKILFPDICVASCGDVFLFWFIFGIILTVLGL